MPRRDLPSSSCTRASIRGAMRCAAMLVAALATAAPAAGQDEAPTTTVVSATDQKPITIRYYPSQSKGDDAAETPVVMLIHGGGDNDSRLVWEKRKTNTDDNPPMAELLNNNGFAVVTVDMRGHGESKAAGSRGRKNFNAMLGDLEGVKEFLMEQHKARRLNINKLAIVAVGEYAPVAARYAEIDWQKPDYDDAISARDRTPRGRDVRALVLFSPELASGRIRTANSLRFLTDPTREVGVLMFSGTDDPRDNGDSEDLAKVIQADREPADNKFLERLPTNFHGTDLFGQRRLDTERRMLAFLKLYLADLDSPWIDRRSKLER